MDKVEYMAREIWNDFCEAGRGVYGDFWPFVSCVLIVLFVLLICMMGTP